MDVVYNIKCNNISGCNVSVFILACKLNLTISTRFLIQKSKYRRIADVPDSSRLLAPI